MNKILFPVVYLALVLLSVNTSAQQLAQKYLKQLPVIPESVCETTDDTIIKWSEKLSVLINEMTGLEYGEKQQLEQAKATAQPRMDIFEPVNAEKIQKLGEEMSVIENKANTIITEITFFYSEKGGEVEVKYLAIMEPLYQQLKEAQSQKKNTSLIDKKIREAKKGKCKEMSVVRKQYLEKYHEHLNELIELGIKGNNISDEMYQMMYSGYTFRTQYGFWLSFIIGYANELSNIYSDVPVYGTERNNK